MDVRCECFASRVMDKLADYFDRGIIQRRLQTRCTDMVYVDDISIARLMKVSPLVMDAVISPVMRSVVLETGACSVGVACL